MIYFLERIIVSKSFQIYFQLLFVLVIMMNNMYTCMNVLILKTGVKVCELKYLQEKDIPYCFECPSLFFLIWVPHV